MIMCKKVIQALVVSCSMALWFISTNVVMAQPPRGPQGGRGGGPTRSWVPYFRYDKAISDSIVFRETVAKFQQLSFQDNATGIDLPYNLFVPKDYDSTKKYPLVLFMHDASVTGREVTATLTQGLGAVVWASDYEQQKHPCFVLAPQYATTIANDKSEASPALDATVNLIASLQKQYSIDADRIYTTGQSGGCMASIALNIKYPELFAASYLCSGQWEPTVTAPLAKMNIWISVAEGDMRAYPGMNAITEFLQGKGATVTKEYISARSTDEQLDFKVKEMLAKHANINYLVLSDVIPKALEGQMRGAPDHMCSWLTTYSIEAIRDWLFSQRKGISLSDKLKDKNNKDVLLAADMGDWHGTVENSLRSIEKAVEKDAAIVPIDLQLTKDGELVLMKDDSLNRVMYVEGNPVYVKDLTLKELRRYAYRKNGNDPSTDKVVPTLADAIAFAQGKILLLIKNSPAYIDKIAEVVHALGAEKMVMLGGLTEQTDTKGLMFMPLVDLDSMSAMSKLQAWLKLIPTAVELRFANRANALLPAALKQTLPVCRVAFDISGKGYAGSFRDMTHDDKPADVFDPMIATGATIFISNEVKPFSRYLKGDPNLWRPGR